MEGLDRAQRLLEIGDQIVGILRKLEISRLTALSHVGDDFAWRLDNSSVEAMMHGGGMTWGSTTYDPELEMIYFGTGNPQPVIAHKGRMGDNLFTECIMALDINTGKRKWYFQSSPHDTHDWDANQTPVLIDAVQRPAQCIG